MSTIYRTISNKTAQSCIRKTLTLPILTGALSTLLISPAMAQFTENVTNGEISNETVTGQQTVGTGGITHDVTVSGNTAYQDVQDGGKTYDTVVQNGGSQNVITGGESFRTIVNDGLHVVVGGISNGTVLNGTATQFIIDNGTANGSTINDGADQHVQEYGTANDTIINAGGYQQVYSFSGASAPAVANSTTINTLGVQEVKNYGIANDTIIEGGTQSILANGTGNGTTINSGNQSVRNGGVANATIVNAGSQSVGNLGIANDTILNGGSQSVNAGGESHGTIINADGSQFVAGGNSYGTIINNGGDESIFSGGASYGTTINSGGSSTVEYNGTANTTTIKTGGEQTINGGVANNTTIDGGKQYLFGTANDTTINAGSQSVNEDGIANDTILNGGSQSVYSGGESHGTIINANGSQSIAGGNSYDTVINADGSQSVASGNAYGTIINSDGSQFVAGGNSYGTIINNGGDESIFSGGASYGTTINSGGSSTVEYNGTANTTTIKTGGEQTINGGVANNTTIDGGVQNLFGTANGTTINAGSQSVGNLGIANDTILNGGSQSVNAGGESHGTIINADGSQFVAGGNSYGTIINDGGKQHIYSGEANNTTINIGGKQFVDTSSTVNDTLVNGGYQSLYGTAHNTVAHAGEIYAGSGSVLTGLTQINGTTTLHGDLITNDGTLRFNPGSTSTITTDITGSGDLNKIGAGTLILNNNNTFTGGTSISGGRLIIGSTIENNHASILGPISVLNNGTLGGHGQIRGSVSVQSGGTVSPGNSIGTLTVGSAHFMNGSIFTVDIHPNGTNSKLVASNGLGTGTVQIDNGVQLSLLGGAGSWSDSTTYNLIDTDNGVTGTFTSVHSNLAFLTPMVDYSNPNQVNLTMGRNGVSFTMVGNTINEKNTGMGIESLGPNHPIYREIVGMDVTQANNAYNNLSGEIHASLKSAILENSRYARHAVLNHLERSPIQSHNETGHNLWINTWAHDGHIKSDGNAARLDNHGIGLIAGADLYQNGATALGAALGYEYNKLKVGDLRNSNANTKAIHLMLYGKTTLGLIDMKAGVGYSRFRVNTERHIEVGSIISKNSAKYHADLSQIFIEGSHTFNVNERIQLAPYIGLLYENLHTNGFMEKGVSAQLRGNSGHDDSVSSTIGIRAQWNISATSYAYANLGWQHGFGKQTPNSSLNFIDGTAYHIKGVQGNRNNAIINLGANFEFRPNMSLQIGYDGKFGNQSKNHGMQLNFKYNF